ncbi:MAG: hypothetical protein JSR96_15360 [Proteobacteria bacterium]|nr:hypothetical protein [Pseudomonadota bacterium]
MVVNAEPHSPDEHNPVASFETGITTLKGDWVGICIKFSMYDRSTQLTHWSPRAFGLLMRALNEYGEHLGANAMMLRAHAEPSLVQDLPQRHPYHTLLTEKPELSEDETGRASRATGIDQVAFAARGPTLELRPTFMDGRAASIFLHEYTALSLLGYLQEYLEAADVLTGPAAGTA